MREIEITDVFSENLLNKYDNTYIDLLKEYFKSIQYLSTNELSLEFNNKDENHGVLVMSTLFHEAKENIRIFAGNFGGKICDQEYYISSLNKAISNGVNLEVVFENEPNKNSKCYKELVNHKIKIYKLKDTYKTELTEKVGKLLHFTVVDKNKFRFETDTENFKAYCNFDDKDNSEILISNFSKLMSNSELI